MTDPNRRRTALRAAALLLAAALAACSDAGAPTAALESDDPLIEQLVAMGAQRENIVDHGDHFVVEGDIKVLKRDLRAAQPRDGRAHAGDPMYQRYNGTVASNRRTIRVNLAALDAENASWAAATRAAMVNWNSAPGTSVSYVEGSPADVTVSFVDYLSGTCTVAQGAYPAGGAPGPTVQISRVYVGTYSYAKQVWIMAHELGHNIGLTHTDQTFGTFIPSTVDYDPGSVMNSGDFYGGCPPGGHIQAPDWAGFSYYDQVAARYLYPATLTATVSYPGGTPLVAWNAVNGATEYRVYHSTWRIYVGGGNDEWVHSYLGSTSATSWADGTRSYTGSSWCPFYTMSGFTEEYYYYRVEAVYPGGSVTALKEADTGPC